MRQGAKLEVFRGVQVRFDKSDGKFRADSIEGSWDRLQDCRSAISAIRDKEFATPAYSEEGGTSNGVVEDLVEVTVVQRLHGQNRYRYKLPDGQLSTGWGDGLYERSDRVLALWKKYQQETLAAHEAEQRAERIKDKIPKFKAP